VLPCLRAQRGKLWVHRDDETPQQRDERLKQEDAAKAAKAKEMEALQLQQFAAAAGAM